MNIVEKIDKLSTERKWSIYKLGIETGLSDKTIRNWFNCGVIPSIEAFNIKTIAFL